MNELMERGIDQTMSSLEVAELTGKRHDNVMRDISNLIREKAIGNLNFEDSWYTSKQNKKLSMYKLDFQATMVLVTGYDAKKRAAVIERWIALEEREAKPAAPVVESSRKKLFELELTGAEYAARILRISDSSKLEKMHLVYKRHGVPTTFLPEYTEKVRTVCSATHLLKMNNCALKVRAFNLALINAGYLEQRERMASRGKMKKYNSLTEKGLKYGQNDAFKGSSIETQAHYYSDTFMELYGKACS